MINVVDLSCAEDIERLRVFSMLEHPASFRYFRNRVFDDAIKTHIVTLMYSTYGYAHIDRDEKTQRHYLGICVLPEYQGQGIGTKLLKTLLNLYTDDVYLTVDNDNKRAIKLYESFHFKRMEKHDTYSLYKRSTSLTLEVSVGEALDKLSILDIKLEKITNPQKREQCARERDAILPTLSLHIETAKRFYTWLVYINRQIWELQDDMRGDGPLTKTVITKRLTPRGPQLTKHGFRFRTDEEEIVEKVTVSNNKYTEENFCKILDLNDMRFRVKQRINAMFDGSFQEQKGYSARVGLFLGHLGMGDLINLNGAIRYSALMVDKLYVICKEEYTENIRQLFSDDPSIHIVSCKNDYSDVLKLRSVETILGDTITQKFLSGQWGSGSYWPNLPYDFYDDLKYSYDVIKLFAHFNIQTTLPIPAVPYIFTHTTSSNGKKDIVFHSTWDTNTILTIDPNKNYYSKDHPWYAIAESYVNKPLFQYKDVIEHAQEIHVMDSSFFCFTCFLKPNTTEKYCYDRSTGRITTTYNSMWS